MTETKTHTDKELRVFGLVLAAVLALIGRKLFRIGWPGAPALWAVAAASALAAVARPSAFRPMMGPWMRLAGVLAVVNTNIVLSVVYYVVLTPLALVGRLFNGDPLEERWSREQKSYWKVREGKPGRETYERQF